MTTHPSEQLRESNLLAHEAGLIPGTRVRFDRGEGVVAPECAPVRCIYVVDADGLRWTVETRHAQVLA